MPKKISPISATAGAAYNTPTMPADLPAPRRRNTGAPELPPELSLSMPIDGPRTSETYLYPPSVLMEGLGVVLQQIIPNSISFGSLGIFPFDILQDL
jgi:hypothetical protein